MIPAQCNQFFYKIQQIAVLFYVVPVKPGDFVVLTVRIVVSVLRALNFVSANEHWSSLAQKQRNKKILDEVREAAFKPFTEILESLDKDLVKGAFAGEKFSELFFKDCKDDKIAETVKKFLN